MAFMTRTCWVVWVMAVAGCAKPTHNTLSAPTPIKPLSAGTTVLNGQKSVDLQTPLTLAVPKHKTVEIDFMARGYFYAGSKTEIGMGGNASSSNLPTVADRASLTNVAGLEFDISLEAAMFKKQAGIAVRLVNRSTKPVDFAAQDGRISILQEALDSDGNWKPIEYLPSSWCGNSYHSIRLEAGEGWNFTAPRYSGPYQTQLRFTLLKGAASEGAVAQPNRATSELPLPAMHSRPYMGSIDPKQFSEKEGHQSTSIMDPYDE